MSDSTRSEPSTPRRHLDAWWIALAGLAVGSAYLAAELYFLSGGLGFPLDDTWIHLQFARQLAAGEGLSYQDGLWVGGSTAPLWTVLLSLGFVLPISPLLWAKVLGIACFAGVAVVSRNLARILGLSRPLQILGAALVLLTPWLAWSALSGMEILAFTFLSLGGLYLHVLELRAPGRLPLSLPILAAAALTRPEGALLLVLATIERGMHARRQDGGAVRQLMSALVLAAIVLLPTLLTYRVLGGSWLPTTFAVKGSMPNDLLPSGRYLQAVVNVLFGAQPILFLLAGAGAIRMIERLGTPQDRGWLAPAWLFGLPVAYAFLAADRGAVVVGNFGRYYFPVVPLVVLLGLLGLDPALNVLRQRFPETRWPAGAALALLLLPAGWGGFQGLPRYLQTVANVEDSDVRAARELADRLPPEAVLAVQDIGAIKFHLPNRIIDLAGIVEPGILPYLHGSGPQDPIYWEQRLLAFLEPRQPDYLLIFERSYPMLSSPPQGFTRVQAFEIENNVTMAGDTLVLIQTPWARHLVKP